MRWHRLQSHASILLVLASIAVSVLLFGFSYEVIQTIRYSRWRDSYHQTGDLYEHLTIASTNPRMIWEYQPNHASKAKTRDSEGSVVGIIETNRYGFRDFDYESADKENDVIRIAFVGDSVTLGLWVDHKDIFVKKFEDKAKRRVRDRKVQGLNFGVDGYNTVQIYEMLRDRVIGFSNDQVVYVMCLNDFDFEEAAAEKILYFRKPRSFLWSRLNKAAYNYRRRKEKDYYFFHYSENRDVVYGTILKMRDLLGRHEVDFRVAIVPVFIFEEDNFDSYKYTTIHREISDFLTRSSIQVHDLFDTFKKRDLAPKDYAYDVWHPNEKGHEVIADALVDFVLAEYESSK
jgi:lysophospholipase L1-like esterase